MIELPFYVISDTHFFHDNIVKYCSRHEQILWIEGVYHDHNEYMIQQWNSVVGNDDRVLHLGDIYSWFADGRRKYTDRVNHRLKGQKYLILGNHDKDPPEVYEELGYTVIEPFSMMINGRMVSFGHYPIDPDSSEIRVHGHIHNNPYDSGETVRRNHINVSVEVVDYTPQLITDLIS